MKPELTVEQKEEVNKQIKKCGCMCHLPDLQVMHCIPCCPVTYMKPFDLK